jgi:DNA-binding response OmpR family regulator
MTQDTTLDKSAATPPRGVGATAPVELDSHATLLGRPSRPSPLEPQLLRRLTPPPQTVLCVEKEGETRAILREALAHFEVSFASSACEALRSFNAHAFDLYVLDYWLPDWSGVALCREIRKTDPHVPICFCTAASRPQDRQRARRAGANAYMTKPLDAELIHDEIFALMQLRMGRNAAAREETSRATRGELARRIAALPPGISCEDVEETLRRSGRSKARTLFLATGGTLASFERHWETMWTDAWKSRSK